MIFTWVIRQSMNPLNSFRSGAVWDVTGALIILPKFFFLMNSFYLCLNKFLSIRGRFSQGWTSTKWNASDCWRFPLLNLFFQPFTNVTGVVDDRGMCQCSVYLPDTTFPVQKVESLEILAQQLSAKFDSELSKVSGFSLYCDETETKDGRSGSKPLTFR